MAVLMVLASLAQSIPLANMFAVYKRIVCRVQDSPWGPSLGAPVPPPPPGQGHCDDAWVAQRTSNYAAAMATAGAIFALLVLARVTALTERFGRKPLLLATLLVLAIGYNVYSVAPLVPDAMAAAAIIFVAVIFLEAAQGIVLRTAMQEYVVDTTRPDDRASMLSFIEGVGQLGAFPGSSLGGYLPTLTGLFNAPFYAAALIFALGMIYVLVCVPESKRSAGHHFWNDLQFETESEPSAAGRTEPDPGSSFARHSWYDSDCSHNRPRLGSRASTVSAHSADGDGSESSSCWPRFLFPLIHVLGPCPKDASRPDAAKRMRMRWIRRHLAVVIMLEESFQVFILPLLLLYNADVLHAGVQENGTLISVLQGARALFLVIIFPSLITSLRRITLRFAKQRGSAAVDESRGRQAVPSTEEEPREQSPLLSHSDDEMPGRPSHTGEHVHWPSGPPPRRYEDGDEDPGRRSSETVAPAEEPEEKEGPEVGALDAGMMILSYLCSCAAFVLIAASGSDRVPSVMQAHPFVVQATALVLLEMGAGGTSLRTALFVNQSPKDMQAQALAASQMMCALVYSTAPLLLSGIYAWSLTAGAPGAVWLVKAGLAMAAALVSLPLCVWFRRDAGPCVRRRILT